MKKVKESKDLELFEDLKSSLGGWFAEGKSLLRNDDFKDGADAREFWEFKLLEAKNAGTIKELKEIAEEMKEYLDDFAEDVSYLREELEETIDNILTLK